ncbi:hypothetical protein BaRGS_00018159 [Batillaria attramentaria]|uniref:Uncharacterized protein n=1 Tax=Batillaria attramentaria TaxID=370345 RepID=A0ABD0KTF6_9CAEN
MKPALRSRDLGPTQRKHNTAESRDEIESHSLITSRCSFSVICTSSRPALIIPVAPGPGLANDDYRSVFLLSLSGNVAGIKDLI